MESCESKDGIKYFRELNFADEIALTTSNRSQTYKEGPT